MKDFMIKKNIGIILLLFVCLLPTYNTNAQTTNAGFIPGNIWYSKDPFEEGDKIKIYTLVFNGDDRELSGIVNFYDKSTLLGKKSFTVGAKGVKDISIDWTVDIGDHKIFAKIENAKFLISSGKYENVSLAENQTDESSRTINKKVIPKATENKIPTIDIGQIQNVQNMIVENTPNFIKEPIVSAVENIEGIRENISTISKNKKEETKKEIEVINTDKTSVKARVGASAIQKPVKYVKLFFYSFCSFIFSNKLVFYGILFLFLFFIVRFVWRKIF